MVDLFHPRVNDSVTIEANHLTQLNVEAVAVWCGGVSVVEHDAFNHETTFAAINVPTIEGMVRAQEGDWVVRDPQGHFYVEKDSIFKERFEPVK